MRTNIDIDDDLMEKALELTNVKTKKAVVEKALKLLVQVQTQEAIRNLRGKLTWQGSLSEMRKSMVDAIVGTMRDLNKSGVVDDITLHNIEKLCVPDAHDSTPGEISTPQK